MTEQTYSILNTSNVVVNIIQIDLDANPDWSPGDGLTLYTTANEGAIGQTWNGTTFSDPSPTADDVWTEKDRRWALGFDYDFNDSRGTQHINTTPKDLQGWNLVTTAAQIAINAGAPTTQITIYPDTVGIIITAAEWQQILGTAAAFFQNIMSSAATLVAISPIPSDYSNDSYWTS